MGSSTVSNKVPCEQFFWGEKVAVWYPAAPEHSWVASLSFLVIGVGHLERHYADSGDKS